MFVSESPTSISCRAIVPLYAVLQNLPAQSHEKPSIIFLVRLHNIRSDLIHQLKVIGCMPNWTLDKMRWSRLYYLVPSLFTSQLSPQWYGNPRVHPTWLRFPPEFFLLGDRREGASAIAFVRFPIMHARTALVGSLNKLLRLELIRLLEWGTTHVHRLH